jgi:hypothetical protein
MILVMRRCSLVLAPVMLVMLACPKPIDPPHEVEPASTTSPCEGEACDRESTPGPCTYDDECPRSEICDGGECLLVPASATDDLCGLPAIQFARDSARLSPNNQLRLADALTCMRELGVIEIAACVDPGEDPELAERRATSVIGLLTSLGLPAEHLRVAGCPTSSGRQVQLRSSAAE